jgi:outer membrane protein
MSYRIAPPHAHRASPFAALLTLAALGATAGTARAQSQPPARSGDAVTSTAPRQRLTGFAGVAVVALPRYAGSDEYRVRPVPIGQLEYKGRVYVGGSQTTLGPALGAYVVRTPSLTWDVSVSGAESRPESRGDALAGMGKRSGASFVTTGLAYRLGVVTATAGGALGLGKDEGSFGTLGLGTELPVAPRWVAGVSTGVTFADARSMAFDFGVTREQSAARRTLLAAGDPRLRGIDVAAYAPGAGLKDVRGGVSLAYLLTPRSRVVLFAQGSRLSDEAARSPLVRARTGAMTGAAIGWGF